MTEGHCTNFLGDPEQRARFDALLAEAALLVDDGDTFPTTVEQAYAAAEGLDDTVDRTLSSAVVSAWEAARDEDEADEMGRALEDLSNTIRDLECLWSKIAAA